MSTHTLVMDSTQKRNTTLLHLCRLNGALQCRSEETQRWGIRERLTEAEKVIRAVQKHRERNRARESMIKSLRSSAKPEHTCWPTRWASTCCHDYRSAHTSTLHLCPPRHVSLQSSSASEPPWKDPWWRCQKKCDPALHNCNIWIKSTLITR